MHYSRREQDLSRKPLCLRSHHFMDGTTTSTRSHQEPLTPCLLLLIPCAIHPSAHPPPSTSATIVSAPFPCPHKPAQLPLPLPQLLWSNSPPSASASPSFCCFGSLFTKLPDNLSGTQKETRACLSLHRTLQGSPLTLKTECQLLAWGWDHCLTLTPCPCFLFLLIIL